MDIAALNANFGLPGVLSFEESEGLTRAVISTPAASATVYLHGAHLTHWQPAGEEPVLFLSDKSAFAKGKAIRGGVPVIFPWFGDRHDGKKGPAHGFARTAEWSVAFAGLVGDDLHLALTLGPDEGSRELGFDNFRLAYRLTLGRTLKMELTVANDGGTPLEFEEALHTYFVVGDVRQASVTGLAGTEYLDKRDREPDGEPKRKVEPEGPLVLTATTDRVYFNTAATCVIGDPVLKRSLTVGKSGSSTTVVWNPWREVAATLADLGDDAWVGMLCVETANAGTDAVTLDPGAAHTMQTTVTVETLAQTERAG